MTKDCSDAIDLETDIRSMQEILDTSNTCMCKPNRRYFPNDVSGRPLNFSDTNLHVDSTIVTTPRKPMYSLCVFVTSWTHSFPIAKWNFVDL